MGLHRWLNYRDDPNWGETVKHLTRNRLGCQWVIEVGSPQTIKQSFKCVARGGEIGICRLFDRAKTRRGWSDIFGAA